MCTPGFLRLALHPAEKNLSNKGTKFPSMNYDALNQAFGGGMVTTWNLWRFHKMVSILS
jgi:hypothetical protein